MERQSPDGIPCAFRKLQSRLPYNRCSSPGFPLSPRMTTHYFTHDTELPSLGRASNFLPHMMHTCCMPTPSSLPSTFGLDLRIERSQTHRLSPIITITTPNEETRSARRAVVFTQSQTRYCTGYLRQSLVGYRDHVSNEAQGVMVCEDEKTATRKVLNTIHTVESRLISDALEGDHDGISGASERSTTDTLESS